MLTALLPGIREFRTCLVTGAILLASCYLLWQEWIPTNLEPDDSLISLLALAAPTGSLALLVLAAYLAGAVYQAGIETAVDMTHRRTTTARRERADRGLKNRIVRTASPLSEKAVHRVAERARSFFVEQGGDPTAAGKTADMVTSAQDQFVGAVFADLLWMEGKLVGTEYLAMYTQIRAEGAIRLGIACLMPLLAVAIGVSANLPLVLCVVLALLATATTAVLLVQGFYQHRKATSFVAHQVADGSLLTPSMESLRATSAAQ